MEDGGEGLAPVEGFSAAEVASAEDCVDLVGGDHFLVLGWDFEGTHGDVEVAQNEGELTHLLLFRHVDWIISNI